MDGDFSLDPILSACLGVPLGILLASLAALGAWDRKARSDPWTLALSAVALLVNLGVCVLLGPGVWCFWAPVAAATACVVALVLSVAARYGKGTG
jgi:hypothetical protein